MGGVILAVVTAAAIYFFIGFYRHFLAMETFKQDEQLTIYTGGGGNSIVLTSEDGTRALVVDTKMKSAAKKLRKAITAPEIIVVNTHAHYDHTEGNELYEGATIIAGAYPKKEWAELSHGQRYPDIALKPGEEKDLDIGGERVRIINMGQAHTSNDLIVYLEDHKLLASGDLVFANIHPSIFPQKGSSVAQWIDVLDRIHNDYNIKLLVPGHGEIQGKPAIEEMKNYFSSIRDAVVNGSEEELTSLKKKYSDYYSVPFAMSFQKTVDAIKKEFTTAK